MGKNSKNQNNILGVVAIFMESIEFVGLKRTVPVFIHGGHYTF